MTTSAPHEEHFRGFEIQSNVLAFEGDSTNAYGRAARRWQAWLLCSLLGTLVACGNYGALDESGLPTGLPSGSGGSNPADGALAFSTTAYPILAARCQGCHEDGPGSPLIAHSDVTTAYHAVVDNQKVNLGSPIDSRLVQRLVADFHFCWTDCVTNGAEMQAAIEAWAALVAGSGGGTGVTGLESSSQTFADGTEDTSAQRYDTGIIARWEFKEGSGDTAFDSSGVAPTIDLDLQGDVLWMPNHGIDIVRGRAIAPSASSRKLYDLIASPTTGSGQFSVEAWVTPLDTAQDGPARIITYSSGTQARNFTLGQVTSYYDLRLRSMAPGVSDNGTPSLQTNNDEDDLQAALQHVVLTFDRLRGRRIYVNGRFTDDFDPQGGALLWNWDETHHLVMGRETSNNRQWKGQIRFAAVYDHALPDAEILKNFQASVGKKLRLGFDVSPWVGADSSIEFDVSELDAYSYLFCAPTLKGPNTAGVRVENIRIAVNDLIPVSGQAFTNVSAVVDPAAPELSRQCSVVQKANGPDQDVFKIVFEVLGDFNDPVPPNNPPPVVDNSVDPPLPIEGVRNFARINDTMASVTGVDPNGAAVQATFAEIEQQLPQGYDVRSFVSSNQVGILKLGLEYCNALVDDPLLRANFFGAFEFDQPVAVALSDPTKRDLLIGALVDGMLGSSLATQPSLAEVSPVMNTLIDDLTAQCGVSLVCDAARTQSIAKAMCASVLSSAAVSMH